jgi:hypothetical protein
VTTNRPDWALIDHTDGYAYGATLDGDPVAWNPATDGHALFAGAAGSGKTAATAAVAYAALTQGADIALLNPFHGGELTDSTKPYAVGVAENVASAAALLGEVEQEIQRRAQALDGTTPASPEPPFIVIVDEYLAFTAQHPKAERTPAHEQVSRVLADILHLGRATGVHLLNIAQRPTLGGHASGAPAGIFKTETHRTLFGHGSRVAELVALREATDGYPLPRGYGHTVSAQSPTPTPFRYWIGTDEEYAYRLRHRLGRGKQHPIC